MLRRGVAPSASFVGIGVLTLMLLVATRTPVLLSALTAVHDPRLGAVEAFRARDRADAAGVRWSRLVFFWSAIQPNGPRSWNWSYFPDELLRKELSSGRRIVGLLINTPTWAGDGGPAGVPRGLGLPPDHSDNHWASFARAMAERYRGRINHWVVWNEPDIWDPASPLYAWSGSVEEFYRLQKVAYLAIKQGNPDAQVGLPGLTYWWDQHYGRPQYFERLLRIAADDPDAPANNWFFDAAVLHLYNEPDRLYQAPTLFRELMAARGIDKPIWINETNVPPWDDPTNPLPRGEFRVTQEEQASYVVQAFAMALAAGVEHISLYPFSDANVVPGDERMGLVRKDGSTRPAYDALKTVTRHLSGVRRGHVERDGDAVTVTLERDVGRTIVAWSTAARAAAVSIAARSGEALLVDKYGRESRLVSLDGRYRLTLEAASACAAGSDLAACRVGGDPVLLVEP